MFYFTTWLILIMWRTYQIVTWAYANILVMLAIVKKKYPIEKVSWWQKQKDWLLKNCLLLGRSFSSKMVLAGNKLKPHINLNINWRTYKGKQTKCNAYEQLVLL